MLTAGYRLLWGFGLLLGLVEGAWSCALWRCLIDRPLCLGGLSCSSEVWGQGLHLCTMPPASAAAAAAAVLHAVAAAVGLASLKSLWLGSGDHRLGLSTEHLQELGQQWPSLDTLRLSGFSPLQGFSGLGAFTGLTALSMKPGVGTGAAAAQGQGSYTSSRRRHNSSSRRGSWVLCSQRCSIAKSCAHVHSATCSCGMAYAPSRPGCEAYAADNTADRPCVLLVSSAMVLCCYGFVDTGKVLLELDLALQQLSKLRRLHLDFRSSLQLEHVEAITAALASRLQHLSLNMWAPGIGSKALVAIGQLSVLTSLQLMNMRAAVLSGPPGIIALREMPSLELLCVQVGAHRPATPGSVVLAWSVVATLNVLPLALPFCCFHPLQSVTLARVLFCVCC